MKLPPKFALMVFLVLTLVIIGFLGWFSFYRGHLPNVGLLAQFAPDVPGVLSDPCLPRPLTVVPASEIGKELREAIKAAEAETTRPFQVARFLLCGGQHRGNLRYDLDQYRLVWQIRWRFNEDQLLTIYMNRVYFANDIFGVADASLHFFGKKPSNLSVSEAALLAGMIRAPGRFSPYKYPDAALQRRNQVIEVMRVQGTINAAQASKAESTPLGVLSQKQ